MDEFLKVEYEQSLSLLKYYDERHLSLVKFAAGISSAVPPVIFAFYKLGGQTLVVYWHFIGFIGLVTALSLLVIYTALVQNRLYFIYPARQVNAIRKACLESREGISFENQMYTDVSFSAFKWASAHTLMNGFVSLQISIFVGLAFFSLYFGTLTTKCLVITSIGVGLSIATVIFGLSSYYLAKRSRVRPDVSVHGRKEEQSE